MIATAAWGEEEMHVGERDQAGRKGPWHYKLVSNCVPLYSAPHAHHTIKSSFLALHHLCMIHMHTHTLTYDHFQYILIEHQHSWKHHPVRGKREAVTVGINVCVCACMHVSMCAFLYCTPTHISFRLAMDNAMKITPPSTQ